MVVTTTFISELLNCSRQTVRNTVIPILVVNREENKASKICIERLGEYLTETNQWNSTVLEKRAELIEWLKAEGHPYPSVPINDVEAFTEKLMRVHSYYASLNSTWDLLREMKSDIVKLLNGSEDLVSLKGSSNPK